MKNLMEISNKEVIMKRTIAQSIASAIGARDHCLDNNNQSWVDKHENNIEALVKQLPSGSGIDYGTRLDYERSTSNKLVFLSAFHVMDENGYYAGIVDYRVIVTASLVFGCEVNIIGNFSGNKDAYGVKDYLFDLYTDAFLSRGDA